MARLYADENFPLPVVAALRLLGHDVLTVEEAGGTNMRTPDLEILDFAISQDRAVLTLNRRHFIRLHDQVPDHKGIIVCMTDTDFSG
jgi:predicted nuclease of predicted toxin-antitoxin system